MKTEYKKHLLSLLALAVLVVLAAGSTDSGSLSEMFSEMETEMQQDFHGEKPIPEGNKKLNSSSHGTTLEQKRRTGSIVDNTFYFAGYVTDVTEENVAKVQLDASNHATVTFVHSVARLTKGTYITFRAKVDKIGTGTLTNHKLSDATQTK